MHSSLAVDDTAAVPPLLHYPKSNSESDPQLSTRTSNTLGGLALDNRCLLRSAPVSLSDGVNKGMAERIPAGDNNVPLSQSAAPGLPAVETATAYRYVLAFIDMTLFFFNSHYPLSFICGLVHLPLFFVG